ncbi:MAG: DUF58 domain-containing protein [Planctomycetes bacterium]|nr:DUF58 domain-containing protein [Planctomycetota bacterium]
MADYGKFLDPRTLARISRLEIRARFVVEGFIAGLHRSPYRGFSVEFAEHREYAPGDDVRHVDWKVFGRTDRFYVKQYEEETNLRATILLDTSESMQYGAGPLPKLGYGQTIAAAIAFLILRQQDAAGLITFDSEIRRIVPPSSSQSHLAAIVEALEDVRPARRTDLAAVLRAVAAQIRWKGLLILISDMFDHLDRIRAGLSELRHHRHDVLLFHVLDGDELSFPFERMTLFEGLEEMPDALVDPRALRDAYLEELLAFNDGLRRVARQSRIDYALMDTRQPLDVPLSAFLASRAGRLRR